MKRYAIVTFLFNDYDILREPSVVDSNFDYYCLTDDKGLSSDIWNCIYIEDFDGKGLTDRQKVNIAKYNFNKYLPKEYEWWICIDSSIKIINELSSLIRYFEDNSYDVGFSIQYKLKSFKDEYEEFMECGRIDSECAENFHNYVSANGIDWSLRSGVLAGTMKIYKNTEVVIDLLNEVCSIYKDACDYKDLDDQCYLTIAFSKFDDRLKTCFFFRQLYHTSIYFERYDHKSDIKYLMEHKAKDNNNILFNRERNLITFPSRYGSF